jgi:hypothetical protein
MEQKEKFYSLKLIFILSVFLITLSLSAVSFGGTHDSTIKANSIKTLKNGINSSNRRLAESCIYIAGFYAYTWAVDPLGNVLNDSTKDIALRILAAYSLEMIGDEKGMKTIRAISISDRNFIVQNICKDIYNNYLNLRAEALTVSK